MNDSVTLPQELVDARNALALAQSVAPIATFVFDFVTEIAEATPAMRAVWGLPPDMAQVRLSTLLEFVHPEDLARVRQARNESLKSGRPYHVEYRINRSDGETRHLRSDGQFFYDADGTPIRNVGATIDITDQMETKSAIDRLMGHDKLTGLLDRDTFMERVRETALASQEPFALVVFDLDRFGEINERFGMTAADTVLRTIGERLKASQGDGEYFARIGGDEFAGVVRLQEGNGEAAAARIQRAVEPPMRVRDARIEPSATIGIAFFPSDATDDTLTLKASLAMSQLKSRGGHGMQRYHPDMERMLAERRHLEMTLRGALQRGEFELYFQPLVDGKSLAVRGAEALIRWNHPSLGVVPPAAFLPVAESARLLQDIDAWVLRQACHASVELAKVQPGLRIGINLTAHSLLSPAFESMLESALRESRASTDALVVEITEQALLADHAQALASLSLLRDAGISIALDDFGTGYNTISYLHMYPISTIKIDRSFIADLERYPYSRSVCSGIVALAAELDLQVVAEGVETEEQQEFLRSLKCEMLQGYLYGRPTPKPEFARLLSEVNRRAS